MEQYKSLLYFVVGLGIGAAAGFFGAKRTYEKKYSSMANQQIREMEEYYGVRDMYLRSGEDNTDDQNEGGEKPEGSHRMTAQERADAKAALKTNNKNPNHMVRYDAMYNGQPVENLDELASLSENIEPSEEEDPEDAPEYRAHVEHQKNKDRPPRIISMEEAGNLPEYIDQKILTYNVIEDAMYDEEENRIESPEYLIGDALSKYHFLESDEDTIFVMNYALDTCYELTKTYL